MDSVNYQKWTRAHQDDLDSKWSEWAERKRQQLQDKANGEYGLWDTVKDAPQDLWDRYSPTDDMFRLEQHRGGGTYGMPGAPSDRERRYQDFDRAWELVRPNIQEPVRVGPWSIK